MATGGKYTDRSSYYCLIAAFLTRLAKRKVPSLDAPLYVVRSLLIIRLLLI